MTPTTTIIALVMAVLVVVSGTVSGSETAFFSLNPGQLQKMSQSSSRLQRLIAHLVTRPRRLLLQILLLNNVTNVAYFALASTWARVLAETVSPTAAAVLTTVALAVLIVFGEILPKVLASAAPQTYASMLVLPMWVAGLVLAPLLGLLDRLTHGFLGSEDSDHSGSESVSADELKLVIEQTLAHGVVSEQAHDRLLEVVDLSESTVGDAMSHRIDCTSIHQNASSDAIIAALRDNPSAILMVLDDAEECVGLLHAQDLLRGGRPAKRARKPLYLPANATLAQALELMRARKQTASVVVDEYGGTLGLLTLGHIGYALLGPGANVDLPQLPQPEQLDQDRWRLPGQLPLEAWEPLLRPEDRLGCTTIGGFMTKMLGSIPQRGDRLIYNNLLFQIESLRGRRIEFILVQKLSEQEARRITRSHGQGSPG